MKNMSEKFDVVVVGAGPSGSFASRLLAEKGYEVGLIDKKSFPREKPCGGGVTLRAWKIYGFHKINPQFSVKPVKRVLTYARNDAFEISGESSNEPLFYGVNRAEFDYELFKMAEEAGAKTLTKNHVTSINISEEVVEVKTFDGKDYFGKAVIGADGFQSTVARKAGLFNKWKSHEIGACYVSESPLMEGASNDFLEEEVAEIHLDIGSFGYGWVFPKERALNVGVGGNLLESRALKIFFNLFVQDLKKRGVLKNIDFKPPVIGLIPVSRRVEKTFRNRLLLTGDAAGFINPLTGEGLYHAAKTAQLAVETLDYAFAKDDFSSETMVKYQEAWKEELEDEFEVCEKVVEQVYKKKRGSRIASYAKKDAKLRQHLRIIFFGDGRHKKALRGVVWRYFINRLKTRFKP